MSPWIPVVLSVVTALATLAVAWGYFKKSMEVLELSLTHQEATLEELKRGFTALREEVRTRFAYEDGKSSANPGAHGRLPAAGKPAAPPAVVERADATLKFKLPKVRAKKK